MLREIACEHFKAFRKRVRVPLAPLTLLFGGNSAGKSSVIHALHFAREVLIEGNLDPDRTRLGGAGLDLGGFVNMAHMHDLERPVVLGFVLDSDALGYDEEEAEGEETSTDPRLAVREGGRVRIEFGFRSGPERRTVWVSFVELYVDDAITPAVRIERDASTESIASITNFDPNQWIGDASVPLIIDPNTLELPAQKLVYNVDKHWGLVDRFDAWRFVETIETPEGPTTETRSDESWDVERAITEALAAVCSQLREELGRLLHVGPIRDLPDRHFRSPTSPAQSRWYKGLAAWDLLQHSPEAFVDFVNRWLKDDDGIDARVGVRIREVLEVDPEKLRRAIETARNEEDFTQLQAIANGTPARVLVAEDLERRVTVAPRDLGVGISQVVPVVVAALQPEKLLVAIEQPELHVHPRVAVGLGDLLLSQLSRNKQFLIETHSEHLLLRVLRRVRNTHEGTEKDELRVTPEQVSIVYFDAKEGEVSTIAVHIDKTGAFVDAWPHGFFEERLREIVGADDWSMPEEDQAARSADEGGAK